MNPDPLEVWWRAFDAFDENPRKDDADAKAAAATIAQHYEPLLAEVERLRSALRKIDRHNDNPAWFSVALNDIVLEALGEKS